MKEDLKEPYIQILGKIDEASDFEPKSVDFKSKPRKIHIDSKGEVVIKEEWQELLSKSINTIEELSLKLNTNLSELEEVVKKYPLRINPYYLGLIKEKDDPIWRQCVPDLRELTDPIGMEDPLHEDKDSPVPGLTHRYPDRVLLLISNQCAMYCRFCTRKRKVGDPAKRITKEQIMQGINYIRAHPKIRDVILSGGDPLLLKDGMLEFILRQLRKISHIEVIRIGTRIPCALPQRVTPELCNMLKKYHPLYINIHFNHPDEITPESMEACEMLADAGIPLGCQTVLLKGVNDSPKVMKELMHKLLKMRVKPYYIYQCDLARGVNHFRTKISKGLEVISALRGHTSGLAVPHYVVDAPGGGGKIPVQPDYVVEKNEKEIVLRNYAGKNYTYPETGE
ncbi:MAG: lysine 2,3-aminomutase [Candidatus Altiarchaeales archaeon]|nr:lysine 2,3-aminomutase [Candidatus Altiarchaeales archaeon]